MTAANPELETISFKAEQSEDEFILAQIEEFILAIPSVMVAKVLIIDRTQILPLPFYQTDILGCIHHEGDIVPVIAGGHLFGLSSTSLYRPNLTVLRLSEAAKPISGIGLTVNQLLGNKFQSQIPAEIFKRSQALERPNPTQPMKLFNIEMIDSLIWHTQHWSIDRSA